MVRQFVWSFVNKLLMMLVGDTKRKFASKDDKSHHWARKSERKRARREEIGRGKKRGEAINNRVLA